MWGRGRVGKNEMVPHLWHCPAYFFPQGYMDFYFYTCFKEVFMNFERAFMEVTSAVCTSAQSVCPASTAAYLALVSRGVSPCPSQLLQLSLALVCVFLLRMGAPTLFCRLALGSTCTCKCHCFLSFLPQMLLRGAGNSLEVSYCKKMKAAYL